MTTTALDFKRMITVSKDATVMDAVRVMLDANIGATAVTEEGRLLGILSEHDVVARVVLKHLDPERTAIADVMRTEIATVRENADRASVLRIMSENHVQHLPVIDGTGHVMGMLTLRHLLRAEVQDLKQTVWELASDTMSTALGG